MTQTRRTGGNITPFIICAAALIGAAMPTRSVDAQRNYMGTFTWATALPSGDTKDFVDTYSFWGFTIEGDWFMRPNLSSGFVFGWQGIYHEDDLASFDFSNGTATGRAYRHLGVFPILVRARYWAGGDDAERTVFPFGGLGIGTYFIRQTVDFGILTADESHWHFGMAPEAGVLFGQKYGGVAWTATVRYNYPFNAGDYLNGDKAAWSYWGFVIGVGVTPR